MTPRRAMAWLVLNDKVRRADDARMFGVVRAAMHADKEQAQKFLDRLDED